MGHVREDVADLAFDVVAVLLEQLQYPSHEGFGLHYCLHLRLAARSDVGQHPASLTSDYFLVVVEDSSEQSEDVVRDEFVGVFHISGGDVTQDADGGDEQSHGWLFQVSDDTGDYSALHHQLYLVLIRIGVVGDGPAAVGNDLLIVQSPIGDRVTEDGDGVADVFILGKRTAPAEVGQSPAAMLDQGLIGQFFCHFHQVEESSCPNDGISVEDAIG